MFAVYIAFYTTNAAYIMARGEIQLPQRYMELHQRYTHPNPNDVSALIRRLEVIGLGTDRILSHLPYK